MPTTSCLYSSSQDTPRSFGSTECGLQTHGPDLPGWREALISDFDWYLTETLGSNACLLNLAGLSPWLQT